MASGHHTGQFSFRCLDGRCAEGYFDSVGKLLIIVKQNEFLSVKNHLNISVLF